MIFPELFHQYEEYLNTEIKAYDSDPLSQPIAYIMRLPAKRIRAILVLLGYELIKNDIRPALPIAHAFELFHNFTLMHDDIMDEAETRRGQLSTHRRFGLNSAILSGDALMIFAYKYLQQNTDRSISPLVWQQFNSMALEVCQGQQKDMDFASKVRIPMNDYLEMIRLKTAVLLGHALKAGVVQAQGSELLADSLYLYGESLGLAFQIQDDYLDLYGNPSETGKQRGGDILQKKKSYPTTLFYAKATEQQISAFNDIYTAYDTDDKIVDAAIRIFSELHIEEETQAEVTRLYKQVGNTLSSCNLSTDKSERLLRLMTWLQGRVK